MTPRAVAAAGLAGALTTNVLHEIVRRTLPRPPRVDLLGMQALAKSADAADIPAPRGRRLYLMALAGDLASNSAYFALTAASGRRGSAAYVVGGALGIVAGIGAVVLPRPLGLAADTTSRSLTTALLTVAVYTAGGFAAGAVTAKANA